jgi:hypothetical protein
MANNNKEMSEEDFLRKHLEEQENKSNFNPAQNMIDQSPSKQTVDSTRTTDLQYFNYDVKDLPCGKFYPSGTLLMIRPAQVKEIQAYSMVDDNNFYDIVEKMNDMLQACVRVKYTNGNIASYLDVKDQDRLFLVFVIRELTFQSGNSLGVSVKCTCGAENQVELIRTNFKFHEYDTRIDKFYNKSKNSFVFKTINNKEFELTPPNIGIQKSFTDYIIRENNENKTPNLSFLKIIPFMLEGRTSITYEGIKSKLQEFEQLDDVSFQFLNGAVSKMTFGIKDLSKSCSSCGVEVRTEMQFPNGASGIFVVHDAFEAFIKE